MRVIEFTKMVASGNDFVIINNIVSKSAALKSGFSNFAKKVCRRKFSIGADGVLVLGPSSRADFKMRIFNADGSEAEMCGNGIRCAALLAHETVLAKRAISIETIAGIQKIQIKPNGIRINMPGPTNLLFDVNLALDGENYKVHHINTGVPHSVVFVKDIERVDVKALGAKIRYHKRFKPKGTNVNFVGVIDKKNIKIRTYERGVEDETLACGTGSVASAIMAALINNMNSPVSVHTRSGDILKVYFDIGKDNAITDVCLEGDAEAVYNGRIEYV